MDFEPNEHAANGVPAGQAVLGGQARHNSSNVGGVTGQVGHNSSIHNIHIHDMNHDINYHTILINKW